MTQRRVSIHDVATAAGVSITTVSHSLNEVPGTRVNKETRARVRAVAAEIGYVPSSIARSLRTNRTGTVALLGEEIATTPFLGNVILGAQRAVGAHGDVLVVSNVDQDHVRAESQVRALVQRQIDGALFGSYYHRRVSVPLGLARTPVVVLNAFTDDARTSSVVPDEVHGGWDATDVLVSAGHRRLAYLNNRDDIPASHGRLAGFRARAAEAGLAQDDLLVVDTAPDTRSAFGAAMTVLDRPDRPTGVFCFNDQVAMGVYNAAAALGIRLPDDLSVVGFDNLALVAEARIPALTTVSLPHYEMAVWAVRQLYRHMAGTGADVAKVALRGSVIHRESVSSPS